MFLHVHTTNTPARSLSQSRVCTSSSTVLWRPEYYSFRSDLQQQQQQEGPVAAAAAMQSTWGLGAFSGNDAALLVMQLARASLQTGESAAAAAAAAAATSTGSSSSSSRIPSISGSNSDLGESAAAVAASSRSFEHPQLQQQQQPSIASSSSSSRSDLRTAPDSPSAAEAVSAAAAAAAARLLLGPAIGILGLTPKPRNHKLRHQQFERRGELVDSGNNEFMVQVREGSNVFVFDPDELPADVVLSDRDRALLQQQQAVALIQQQQQQQQHSDKDDDHHHDAGSGSNAAGTQQQLQQREAAAAVPAASLQHLNNSNYEEPCCGEINATTYQRLQQPRRQQQQHQRPLHVDDCQHTPRSRHGSQSTVWLAQPGPLHCLTGYPSCRPLHWVHCGQQHVVCTSRPGLGNTRLGVVVEAHAPYDQQRQQQWQVTSQPRGLLRVSPAGMPVVALLTVLHKMGRHAPAHAAARPMALA